MADPPATAMPIEQARQPMVMRNSLVSGYSRNGMDIMEKDGLMLGRRVDGIKARGQDQGYDF